MLTPTRGHLRASFDFIQTAFPLTFSGAAALCLPILLRVKETPCSRLQSCQHSGVHPFNNKNCTWEQKLQEDSLFLSGLSQMFWVFLPCWLSSAGGRCSLHRGLLPAARTVLPLPGSAPRKGTSSIAKAIRTGSCLPPVQCCPSSKAFMHKACNIEAE